jgi:hypothetical protein
MLFQKLKEKASLDGTALDPAVVVDLSKQVAVVTGAFFSLNKDLGKSQAIASSLFGTLIDNQRQIQNAFAGTETQFPKLAEQLSISLGDVSQAFDLIKSGPQGFIDGMSKMVAAAQKKGPAAAGVIDMLRARLEQVIDPSQVTDMMLFFRKFGEAGTNASKDIATVSDKYSAETIANLRKPFRTLQEQMTLIEDLFVTKLRKVASANKDMVDGAGAAFTNLGDKLVATAAQGGPMGKIITKMIEMHQVGLKALVPKDLRPEATFLSTIINQAGPTLDALEKVGLSFKNLTSPLGILQTAVSAVFGDFALNFVKASEKSKDMKEAFSVAFQATGKDIMKFLDTAVSWIETGTSTIYKFIDDNGPAIRKKFEEISKSFAPAIETGVGLLRKAMNWVFEQAFEVLYPLIDKWGPPIGEALAKAVMVGFKTLFKIGFQGAVAAVMPQSWAEKLFGNENTPTVSAYKPELKKQYENQQATAAYDLSRAAALPNPAIQSMATNGSVSFPTKGLTESSDRTDEIMSRQASQHSDLVEYLRQIANNTGKPLVVTSSSSPLGMPAKPINLNGSASRTPEGR